MPLFQIKNQRTIEPIKEEKFKLEKDMQALTEANLDEVFGLEFVATEFALHGFRLDTLAFDKETNAFVIIEYKRGSHFSVIDQGFSYLQLMLNNKADFILEYNERMKSNLTRTSVDWSQSRVLFVANGFTNYQRESINFKDLPIELWEVKKYKNGSVLYNQLKADDSSESINTVSSKDETISKVAREVKKYSVDDHFKEGWDVGRELYSNVVERLQSVLNDFELAPTRHYIGVKIGGKNLIEIISRKSGLRIQLLRVEPKDLKDPDKRVKYRNRSYEFYHVHISVFDIKREDDIDYAIFLVKQVYEKVFG